MTPAQLPPQPPPERFPLHTLKVGLVSLLCLAAVSYVDYVTGYEFLFFVFYFIPVGVCGWYLGRVGRLSMAVFSWSCWFLSQRRWRLTETTSGLPVAGGSTAPPGKPDVVSV